MHEGDSCEFSKTTKPKKNKLLPTECFESDTLYAGAGAGAATAPTHS